MHAVTEYAMEVLGGQIRAGKRVVAACQRHVQDLERQGTNAFPYVFDEERANRIIDFAEMLKYTDGEPGFVNTPVRLHGFAKFILGSLFGWVNRDTHKRRYKKGYIQVARKNIKSLLESIVVLYMCAFDNYANAQVYCTATKMKQARVVWGQASKFIKNNPDLQEIFKIREHDAEIECLLNGGKIMALGRDTGTIDGFDPHCGVVDEYHAHRTNQMVKLLQDGAVNQQEFLINIITTAGFDLNCPCFEEYEYCCNFLDTEDYNDNYFAYIAQMDEDDDIMDPENWIKCNPLVATLPHGVENIKIFVKEAIEKGGEDYRNLITKTFNVWQQIATEPLIKDFEDWKTCGTNRTLEDMRGKSCVAALDLSSGGDLTTLCLEFDIGTGNEPIYYFYSHSFMPEKRLAEHIKTDKNAHYDRWHEEGLITLTATLGGLKTDYKYITKHLRELIEDYGIRLLAIGYDPHNADAFLSDLEAFGVSCIEVKQSARFLSDATEDFRLCVESGHVEYNRGSKLFTWSVRNAGLTYNSFGEMKVDKEKRTMRIDPVDAAIDAHKVMMSLGRNKPIDISKYASDEYLEGLWGDD